MNRTLVGFIGNTVIRRHPPPLEHFTYNDLIGTEPDFASQTLTSLDLSNNGLCGFINNLLGLKVLCLDLNNFIRPLTRAQRAASGFLCGTQQADYCFCRGSPIFQWYCSSATFCHVPEFAAIVQNDVAKAANSP